MTNDDKKTEIVQFRLSPEQLEMLDKAFKHYLSHAGEVITRSEFIRQAVMMACLKEVGMIKVGKNE